MNHKLEPVSPQFIHILTTSLAYWQRLTVALDDDLILQIDGDKGNVYRAIEMGLSLEQTRSLAIEVALQTFFLAERRNYWQEWGELFESALRLGEAIEPQQRQNLWHRLGELYRQAQQLTEAITVHKKAEAFALAQGDALAIAEARYRLAWDYLQTRQYDEAEACCRFAIDTFTQLEERADLLTNSYWALGSVERRRGKLDMAQSLLSQAIEMGRTTQQLTHRARMVCELGNVMTVKGLYDEALVYFDEAVEILAETASERDRIDIQLNRAIVFYRQEQWPEVEAAWRQIMDSAYIQQSGDIYLQAMLAHNLSMVLLKTDELVEAEAQINYALQLRQNMQDDIALASTIGSLAQIRARQGKKGEAISLFTQVKHTLETYPDDAYAQRILRIIEEEMQALER